MSRRLLLLLIGTSKSADIAIEIFIAVSSPHVLFALQALNVIIKVGVVDTDLLGIHVSITQVL